MKGRSRYLRELSIANAFDVTRLKADAQSGRGKSLKGYLDEMLSPAEQMEKSSREVAFHLDAMIGLQQQKEE